LKAAGPLFPRTLREQEQNGIHVDSIFFCSEPGVMVTGCLLARDIAKRDAVALSLVPAGTTPIDDHLATMSDLLYAGHAVFVFDVRGTGAVKSSPVNPHPDTFPSTFFNTEAWFAWSAYCLGESLLGMCVFDVLRAVQYLHEAGYRSISLRAEGLAPALWGYLAAALDPGVEHTRIRGLLESFEAVARTQLYRFDFTPALLIHSVLQEFDLPELRGLFHGRVLEVSTERA
jgi:hypothetical protein